MSMLSIFLLGIYLNSQGLATIGEIVTFMNFAGLLIIRLEQVVGFSNRVLMDAPRLRDSSACSTPCRRCATAPTRSIPAACAA